MDQDKRALRIGAAAIACAAVLRLLSYALPNGLSALWESGTIQKTAVFLTAGRVLVHKPQPTDPPETQSPTSAPAPTVPETTLPGFSALDAEGLSLAWDGPLDKAALLTQPLEWDLYSDEPTVLILHTHGSESYENTEGYVPSSDYRTLDENYNMLSIGDALAERLEAGGIRVLHDRQLHDYPSYNGSYVNARESIQQYLADCPSIRLVLDLHRDAAEDAQGNQVRYTVDSPYGKAAKLMFVMGSHTDARPHPNWQENLSLALKLQAAMEQSAPGITRTTSVWRSRLNQDLSPGAVLVEVGTAGNTRQEALNAAAVLADAVLHLGKGTSFY